MFCVHRGVEDGRMVENSNSLKSERITLEVDWIHVINSIFYYLLPSLLTFSFVLAMFNSLILLNALKRSEDIFLTAFSLGSIILFASIGILHVPYYLFDLKLSPKVFIYCTALSNWFSYNASWLLLMMALERCHSRRHVGPGQNFCGATQAALSSVMVVLMLCVSCVPQIIHHNDLKAMETLNNKTIHFLQESMVAHNISSMNLYRWFIFIISVFLPTLLVVGLLMKLSLDSHRLKVLYLESTQHGSGTILIASKHQFQVNKLCIQLLFFYLIFMIPLPVLEMVQTLFNKAYFLHSSSFRALRQLFVLFYLTYFPVFFALLCCTLDGYRAKIRTFCGIFQSQQDRIYSCSTDERNEMTTGPAYQQSGVMMDQMPYFKGRLHLR